MLQQNEVQKEKKRLYGFTLVELLVVMLVVGILMAVALPNYFSVTADARKSNFCSSLAEVEKALQMYAVRNQGFYPDKVDQTFLQNTLYFSTVPKNPYNNTNMIPSDTLSTPGSWKYTVSTDKLSYTITSTPACK